MYILLIPKELFIKETIFVFYIDNEMFFEESLATCRSVKNLT